VATASQDSGWLGALDQPSAISVDQNENGEVGSLGGLWLSSGGLKGESFPSLVTNFPSFRVEQLPSNAIRLNKMMTGSIFTVHRSDNTNFHNGDHGMSYRDFLI